MKNKSIIILIEVFLLTASVFLALLWAAYPDKNYEPYLAISTVMLAVAEFIRRKFFAEESKSSFASTNDLPISVGKDALQGELQEVVFTRPAPPISSITVREIVDAINSAPPFQKADISKKYNGIIVRWTGFLRQAHEDYANKNCARVNLNVEKESIIGFSFWFVIKINEFPEIKTLNKMSEISVLGEIESASGDGLCVTLKPIKVEVVNRA